MKKDCLNEQTLWEYIDGELDTASKESVEKHLKTCSCCKKAYKEVAFFDNQFAVAVQNCHPQAVSDNEPTSQSNQMPPPMYYKYKGMVWTILTLLVSLSILSALIFVAVITPDVSTLPFSGEFIVLKSFVWKFIEIFLNSSLLIGIIFLMMFGWNYYNAKIRA